MKKLYFSIYIQAPKERVWEVLWEDETFRDWTSVFAEGSHAISEWEEGSTIKFIDPKSNAGMSSVIERLVPNEVMSFKHITEIKDGKEEPPPAWSGMTENYMLKEENGTTALAVEMDAPDEYKEMFASKFPQALQRVKVLSEQK